MNIPEPDITLPEHHSLISIRTQIRFAMAPQSAELAADLRKAGKAMLLSDDGTGMLFIAEKRICWPSVKDGFLILEITFTGPALDGPTVRSRYDLMMPAYLASLTGHGSAEVLSVRDFEKTPPLA